MDSIIEKVFTDPTFIKVGIILAILISLAVFKKLFKAVLILVVGLILYITYLVYTGEDPAEAVDDTIEEVRDIDLKKVGKSVGKSVEKAGEVAGEVLDEIQDNLKKTGN